MKPACSISQAALVFTRSPWGQAGAPSGTWSGSSTGLVKKDPADQVSWSAGSSTMPLAPRRSRTARRTSLGRGSVAGLQAQGAGQLGVAHRLPERPEPQLEGHLEHHPPARLGLEPAPPVAEPAVRTGQRADPPLVTVVGAHPGDGVGDLLAVGADVLDRGGADPARDPRQGLDAPPLLGDGALHQLVPVLPGRHGDHGAAAGVGLHLDPPGGDVDHEPVEPVVADDEVAAAPEHQHRLPRSSAPATRSTSSAEVCAATMRAAGPPRRSVVRSASRVLTGRALPGRGRRPAGRRGRCRCRR